MTGRRREKKPNSDTKREPDKHQKKGAVYLIKRKPMDW